MVLLLFSSLTSPQAEHGSQVLNIFLGFIFPVFYCGSYLLWGKFLQNFEKICTKAHQFEDVARHFEKILTSSRTKVESRSFVGWFTLNGVRVERLYWRLLPTSDKVMLSYCCLDRASLKEDNCTKILQLILNAGPKFRFATEENIYTFIHFHIIEETLVCRWVMPGSMAWNQIVGCRQLCCHTFSHQTASCNKYNTNTITNTEQKQMSSMNIYIDCHQLCCQTFLHQAASLNKYKYK